MEHFINNNGAIHLSQVKFNFNASISGIAYFSRDKIRYSIYKKKPRPVNYSTRPARFPSHGISIDWESNFMEVCFFNMPSNLKGRLTQVRRDYYPRIILRVHVKSQIQPPGMICTVIICIVSGK